MNKLIQYFNYNWFKLIKNNITNKSTKNINKKEKDKLQKLIFKKEICAIIFILIYFLLQLTGSIEIYKLMNKKNIILSVLKDNILALTTWFIILTILPLITSILIKRNTKIKYYLLLSIMHLISNVYNILMVILFIASFINSIILSILGIINIIVTIIINCNIIININENYLKKS